MKTQRVRQIAGDAPPAQVGLRRGSADRQGFPPQPESAFRLFGCVRSRRILGLTLGNRIDSRQFAGRYSRRCKDISKGAGGSLAVQEQATFGPAGNSQGGLVAPPLRLADRARCLPVGAEPSPAQGVREGACVCHARTPESRATRATAFASVHQLGSSNFHHVRNKPAMQTAPRCGLPSATGQFGARWLCAGGCVTLGVPVASERQPRPVRWWNSAGASF